MGRTLKDTLLGTLAHGEEVLEDIRVLRKVSLDKITVGNEVDARIAPLHAKSLNLIVSAIEDTGKNARIIRLSGAGGYLPPFEAGQYINLFTEISGVRTSRPYSISSSPRQRGYYEITVAQSVCGFVSDYLLDAVKVGDTFSANGPAGVFRYQPVFHSKKSLFLAGGSGITPFLSMTREVLEAHLDRDIVLLYGCRNEQAALYHEELSSYAARYPNFRYHLIISDNVSGWTGETGFLDGAHITRLASDYAERTCYICGPQVMNEFCQRELETLGVPEKRIRRELFGACKNIEKEAGWPAELTGEEIFHVTLCDRTIKARANEPLLVALERAGIRVNVCCRSGECSLCRVKLVSGKVFLSKGMLLRKADEQYGYIHSCKAYPIDDVSILL